MLATQNPIEQEGTYPLPEAQVDRFMLKLKLDYPTKEEELAILDRMAGIEPEPDVESGPVGGRHSSSCGRRSTRFTSMTRSSATSSISSTPRASRQNMAWTSSPYIQYGASPRAHDFLDARRHGQAFLEGRGYVTPQDVKSIGYDVLRHRLTSPMKPRRKR